MEKNAQLAVVLALIIIAIFYLEQSKVPLQPHQQEISVANQNGDVSQADSKRIESKKIRFAPGKEITTPDGFINTENITLASLVGKKVALVDFWTYSCINCQRTIPYLNDWNAKYADKGLVIIGVHTPEFEFEKDYVNVKAAVEKFGIKYPVVLDNDFSTWNAYRNLYWPRKYLIDMDGFIVYDHIGEGGYDDTEREIQRTLKERMDVLKENGTINEEVVKPQGTTIIGLPAIRSPETYFGYLRNSNFDGGKRGVAGIQTLDYPNRVSANRLYLSGTWDFNQEYAESTGGSKIIFRYQANNVYFVASADSPVKVKLTRDGEPLGEASGDDAKDSEVEIKDARLYSLIKEKSWGEHTIVMDVPSGVRAFTFTFG
ncbi:MAG: redoxin domain-containing protein [Candidatus Aenigmarchaeota archaeon]|nr:redoxin domain-containing protein [Candidatus Aenigmarchaeota archaeon]